MNLVVRKIEVLGDPMGGESAISPVRLTYADCDNLNDAAEWCQVQLKSSATYGNVLAEVELNVLTQLRILIDKRIQKLHSLEGPRR